MPDNEDNSADKLQFCSSPCLLLFFNFVHDTFSDIANFAHVLVYHELVSYTFYKQKRREEALQVLEWHISQHY